jgi:hypothetical protein
MAFHTSPIIAAATGEHVFPFGHSLTGLDPLAYRPPIPRVFCEEWDSTSLFKIGEDTLQSRIHNALGSRR